MSKALPNLGFGLGLRPQHVKDLLREPQPVDWLEILSENYFKRNDEQEKILLQLRERYPMVMHGVSLSLGGSDPLDKTYLKQLRNLSERIDAAWISDHLCWSNFQGQHLHDLLPLPYTEETIQHLVPRIQAAQEYLGKRLLIENVSSYLSYTASEMPEWEFLKAVAEASDCLILLDINNIFVSAYNHRFDPRLYLQHIPKERVAQIHLAGHSQKKHFILDTHDAPVHPEVWSLYREAMACWGPVSTMIEWDDAIPPLPVLLAELDEARAIVSQLLVFG